MYVFMYESIWIGWCVDVEQGMYEITNAYLSVLYVYHVYVMNLHLYVTFLLYTGISSSRLFVFLLVLFLFFILIPSSARTNTLRTSFTNGTLITYLFINTFLYINK